MIHKVYLAHQYGRRHLILAGASKQTVEDLCQKNTDDSVEYFERPLMIKGYNVYNPLMKHYVHKGWSETLDEATYFRHVAEWIQDCDALLVAKMPEWKNSGVEREIKIAEKLGIPVVYSIEELDDYKAKCEAEDAEKIAS